MDVQFFFHFSDRQAIHRVDHERYDQQRAGAGEQSDDLAVCERSVVSEHDQGIEQKHQRDADARRSPEYFFALAFYFTGQKCRGRRRVLVYLRLQPVAGIV